MTGIRAALACAALLLNVTAAFGQNWPQRPLAILNGFPPGGNTDVVLRQLTAKLSRRLGQAVVVENRPGAAGTIAARAVAQAVPDGYTLLFGVAANLAVAPATMKSPPYDPPSAFSPIAQIAEGPYVWLVNANNPAHNMREFIEWTRDHPGKANYGSPGPGSVHQLATEMLKNETGARMTHVPYKGGSALGAALISGEIDGMFETAAVYLPHIRAGRIRALAVTGNRRLSVLPEVPTLAEQGLPDLDVRYWWGIAGPAGLPAEIVARLNREVRACLADPELKQTYAALSVDSSTGSPQSFGDLIAREYHRYKKFAAESGFVVDR